MRDNQIGGWKYLMTMATVVVFGLSIFIAPAAIADKKDFIKQIQMIKSLKSAHT
jgi:hypothetical protein